MVCSFSVATANGYCINLSYKKIRWNQLNATIACTSIGYYNNINFNIVCKQSSYHQNRIDKKSSPLCNSSCCGKNDGLWVRQVSNCQCLYCFIRSFIIRQLWLGQTFLILRQQLEKGLCLLMSHFFYLSLLTGCWRIP